MGIHQMMLGGSSHATFGSRFNGDFSDEINGAGATPWVFDAAAAGYLEFVPGKFGQCIRIVAVELVSPTLTKSIPNFSGTNPWQLEFWHRSRTYSSGASSVRIGDSTSFAQFYGINNYSNHAYMSYKTSEASEVLVNGGAPFSITPGDVFSFFSIGYDGITLRYHINGVLVHSTASLINPGAGCGVTLNTDGVDYDNYITSDTDDIILRRSDIRLGNFSVPTSPWTL